MTIGTRAPVKSEGNAPQRIVWLIDGPHVVESVTQTEYAAVVKVAPERATPQQVEEWRIRE